MNGWIIETRPGFVKVNSKARAIAGSVLKAVGVPSYES